MARKTQLATRLEYVKKGLQQNCKHGNRINICPTTPT